MKCNYCTQEAKIFLTQIEGTELKKVCLCEDCSKDAGLMETEGLLNALTDNLLPTSASPPPPASSSSESFSCVCGFSIEDLSSTGRLGCPTCFDTFAEILEPRISDLHRGESHIGKKLDIPESRVSVEKMISEVNLALNIAVKEEEFENAARLRDELTSLNEKLSAL